MCQVRGSVVSWQLVGYAGGSFGAASGLLDQTSKTDGVRPGSGRQLQHSAEVQGPENEGNWGRPSRATGWSWRCCCCFNLQTRRERSFAWRTGNNGSTDNVLRWGSFLSRCDSRKQDCDEVGGREGRIDAIRVVVVKDFRGAAGS